MMRSMMLWGMVAAVVCSVFGRVEAGQKVDQSNNSDPGSGFPIGNNSSLLPLGQSFTAGLTSIDFATFQFVNNGGSAYIYTVSLYQGATPSGMALATSNIATVPASAGYQTVEFDFTGHQTLAPGSQYSLIVNPVAAGNASTLVFLEYSDNVYSGGTAIVRGMANSNYDAIFSEGITVFDTVATPEPSTLILAACGVPVLLLVGYRKRRRRVAA